ncbi:uncharacterized protein METZ01_LOCUS97288, partial [marine metagenome]
VVAVAIYPPLRMPPGVRHLLTVLPQGYGRVHRLLFLQKAPHGQRIYRMGRYAHPHPQTLSKERLLGRTKTHQVLIGMDSVEHPQTQSPFRFQGRQNHARSFQKNNRSYCSQQEFWAHRCSNKLSASGI